MLLHKSPATDPVRPADMAATIYRRFGIDPASLIHDHTGRPFKLADGAPLVPLFGEWQDQRFLEAFLRLAQAPPVFRATS
jgi:hypothetical protein